MEEEQKFVIRGYLKSELALMYHPQMTQSGAMGKMRRWINRSRELKERMRQAEVSLLNHSYTPRQVAILVEFLGEP